MVVREDITHAQIGRILHSDMFRNSDVLRRLQRFLADKSIAGEGDQLKEYVIGIDALGKPASYDPRQDSVVRIQVGRLRQKLAEYYRTEGKNDPIVVDLPKGRFKLNFDPRPEPSVPESVEVAPPVVLEEVQGFPWKKATLAVAALLILTLFWSVYTTSQLLREQRSAATTARSTL